MSRLCERLAWWPAVGFGLGLAPAAPGTFGSLLGPPLVWAVQHSGLPVWGQWLIAVGLIVTGGPICSAGAKAFDAKDPGAVVYDEIVAFFIVFAAVPVTWITVLPGFVLFRLFDITKVWPAKTAERLPRGWGILCDDLVAGVYAGTVLWILHRWAVPAVFPGI